MILSAFNLFFKQMYKIDRFNLVFFKKYTVLINKSCDQTASITANWLSVDLKIVFLNVIQMLQVGVIVR